MAQFKCHICNQEFEQRSKLLQHMRTSHPEQAPSAADLQSYLKGIKFPAKKSDLLDHAPVKRDEELTKIIHKLPEQSYRDSAEVSRALGQAISHENKSKHQPSKKGGDSALKSPSASHLASMFAGVKFPKSTKEVQKIVEDKGGENLKKIADKFSSDACFEDMADLEKEFGKVSSKNP